jgi:hypothetical protein
MGLSDSLLVEAVVKVVGAAREPGKELGVTLSVRSDAGMFVAGRAVTGADGIAHHAITFPVPPGSLGMTLQSCLTRDNGACSEPIRVSMRDWVSLDLAFDFLTTVALSSDSLKSADISFAITVSPRVQVNLWESERRWKYSRLSAYGTTPFVYQNRTVLNYQSPSSNHTFGQAADRADFVTGVNLTLRGMLLADVSYNGRDGKLNLVESIRASARPGLVNLGDGFESIDATSQVNVFLGSRTFLFGVGSFSRAMPRSLDGDRIATRGDASQLAAGIGTARVSQQKAVLAWLGRERREPTQMRTRSLTSTLLPSQDRWLAGVTGFGFARRRVNGSTGLLVAWEDKRHVQIGFSGRVNVSLF